LARNKSLIRLRISAICNQDARPSVATSRETEHINREVRLCIAPRRDSLAPSGSRLAAAGLSRLPRPECGAQDAAQDLTGS
jgi:hypothetical protein